MKDLFQMFPSVIINLVNSRVRHKDKLLVKEHDSGSTLYMHDSFLMGIAFSLKVCLLNYAYLFPLICSYSILLNSYLDLVIKYGLKYFHVNFEAHLHIICKAALILFNGNHGLFISAICHQ